MKIVANELHFLRSKKEEIAPRTVTDYRVTIIFFMIFEQDTMLHIRQTDGMYFILMHKHIFIIMNQ